MGASVRPDPAPRPRQASALRVDESKIPPADLWDKKIAEGMPPDSATAYVARIHGPPPMQAPTRRPLISNPSPVRSDVTSTDRMKPAYTATVGQDVKDTLRSAEQGATFGFGDEINAGVRHVVRGEQLADALKSERSSLAEFRDRNPVGATGSELLGSLAGGEGLGTALRFTRGAGRVAQTANEVSAPVRALKSTATGGAAGGAAAAGTAEGDLSDRLRAVPRGMLFGGATAAAMNAGGAVVKGSGKALSNRASQPTLAGRALRGAGVPAAEDLARGDVIRQLGRGGVSIDKAEAAAAANPDRMMLDVGGDQMLRRTRGVHSIPSKGSSQVEEALTERVAGQPDRVQSAVSEGLNSGKPRENAVLAAQQLVSARKAAAAPLYEAAYNAPAIEDPDVIATMKIPTFQEAHEVGRRIAKLEGVDLPPLTRAVKVGKETITEQVPQTVQAIDYMKRGLDDVIEAKTRSGSMARNEARLLRQHLNGMLEKVDAAVPAYAKARAQFAGDSKLMEAHDAGLAFRGTSHDEIAAQWPTMTEGERDLFRRGVQSDLSTTVSKIADGRDVTRLFQNKEMRDKLALILPDQKTANTFFSQLADEAEMHKHAVFVRGGSPTARIQEEQKDGLGDGARVAFDAASGNHGKAASGLLSRFLDSEKRGLTEAQANAMAPLLTAKGGELAKTFDELRQYGSRASRAQAQRSAAVRATAQVTGAHGGSKRP